MSNPITNPVMKYSHTKQLQRVQRTSKALILPLLLGISSIVSAQTNPTAQVPPITQNFGTTSFSSLPAGFAAWGGLSGAALSTQATAEGSAATANATVSAQTTVQTGGGTYGYATSSNGRFYIQTSSNASNGANQLALAIDATGQSSITLGYDVEMISPQVRTIGVVAQYRVGTSGTWTTITATSGSNPYSQSGGTAGVKTTVSATLPAAADNQPVVQVRWATWRGTESGGSAGLAIDNVSVTATAGSDTTPPTLGSTIPADGATSVLTTANLSATFSETVQKGTGNIVIKKVSDDSVFETIDVTTAQVTIAGATVTIDPTATMLSSESYYVEIDATAIKDNAGTPNFYAGLSGNSAWNFTIAPADTTAPTITSLAPADEATEVLLNANLVATFDEPVQKGTGNILIKKTSDNSVAETIDITASTVTVSTNTVTIDPTITLDGATSYYIEIASGAILDTATSPNAFAGIAVATTWNFTTITPDTTAPTVVSVAPTDDLIGVGPNANLSITFNEPIQKGTGFITIKKSADDSIVDQIDVTAAAITAAGSTVTINPTISLSASTEYYVLIDNTAIRDTATAPNNFAGISSTTEWSFTIFTPGAIVISQVYGGGGNSGAPYKNDFVELHNNSSQTITLFGWSVQYASASGTFSGIYALPVASIPSGGYFLVQMAGGSTGASLPTADATGTLNLSGTAGKVALLGDVTSASGATDVRLSDFVGFGTANDSETAAAPAPSNTTSISRLSGGTADTNNNSLDFVAGAPAPRNSSTTPFNPVVDGSGSVTLVNATAASPLLNQPVFAANASAQTVSLTIAGTLPSATISQVSIVVPTEFGAPLLANVSASGPGLNGASASVVGQTISFTGAAITQTNNIVVSIAGITTPDTSTSNTIDGNYAFTVSTASTGGTLTAISPASTAYVVIPIANIRDQDANGVPLDLNKKVAVQGVCTEENFNSPTQTSAYIQSSSGGMNIFSGSLGSTLVRGNEYIVFGNVIQFSGLTEVTYTATSAIFDLGAATAPTAEVVTIAILLANPEAYEGKLVKVVDLSLAPSENDTWASLATITLTDGVSNIDARIPVGSTATSAPFYPVTITGVFSQFDSSSPFDTGYQIMPRDPSDILSSNPPFVTWATGAPYNLTGNDALFDADPDKDGMSNGIEFIVGANPTVANDANAYGPQVSITGPTGNRVATIIYRSTTVSDYLNASLQLSDNLVTWNTAINGQNATVSIDDNAYGAGINKVTVELEANGAKGFVRLFAQSTP